LFLAKKDFEVTAIDFSEKALERLKAFADAEGMPCVRLFKNYKPRSLKTEREKSNNPIEAPAV